jgi:hypothetical protein
MLIAPHIPFLWLLCCLFYVRAVLKKDTVSLVSDTLLYTPLGATGSSPRELWAQRGSRGLGSVSWQLCRHQGSLLPGGLVFTAG